MEKGNAPGPGLVEEAVGGVVGVGRDVAVAGLSGAVSVEVAEHLRARHDESGESEGSEESGETTPDAPEAPSAEA